MKILTWLDVKRLIQIKTQGGTHLPQGILAFDYFAHVLEVYTETPEVAKTVLKHWFKGWFDPTTDTIALDLGDHRLDVEYVEDPPLKTTRAIRPFWSEAAYLADPPLTDDFNNDFNVENAEHGNSASASLQYPEQSFSDRGMPELIAFYSFKGGVGRTTHLAAYLFALLEQHRDKNLKILVIDSDLEAPGLTYWYQSEQTPPTLSFLQCLEAFHYSPMSFDETVMQLAQEIQKTETHYGGKSKFYFVPSFLNELELLDISILPEHITRSLGSPWQYGDKIAALGQALGAEYVFLDLRAGLSEISSPLLLDPRIRRLLVATTAQQSISGLKLVLEQLSRISPPDLDKPDSPYYHPELILSFLPPDLKDSTELEALKLELISAYKPLQRLDSQSNGNGDDGCEVDPLSFDRFKIQETYFAQELLRIKNWEDARKKLLGGTTISDIAHQWAAQEVPPSHQHLQEPKTSNSPASKPSQLEQVQQLKDTCKVYEFAESGQGEGFLVTEPLASLAKSFSQEIPHVVVIGPKGSGKTFIYQQLARLKTWEAFLALANSSSPSGFSEPTPDSTTHIFPLLQPQSLEGSAVQNARAAVRSPLGLEDYSHGGLIDDIAAALREEQTDWGKFWLQQLAKAIGHEFSQSGQNSRTLMAQDLDRSLKAKNLKVIFSLDGLEDQFFDTHIKEHQQAAIRALIQLPSLIQSEIRQPAFGLVIFLRRDFVDQVIRQNAEQFMGRYKAYALSWDVEAFLRLVYWICAKAGVEGFEEEQLSGLGLEDLKGALERLWGKKLGGDSSKEAISTRWVYAALIDFNGELQARDVVRLLYHAAEITQSQPQAVQFPYWSSSRLLPPQAIRRALKPCSKQKVDQAKEEYPQFKKWVDETIQPLSPDLKKVPITSDRFASLDIDPSLLTLLKGMGVIYEDRAKGSEVQYYIPEIFRISLGFEADRGARPRVLILQRSVLGKVPL